MPEVMCVGSAGQSIPQLIPRDLGYALGPENAGREYAKVKPWKKAVKIGPHVLLEWIDRPSNAV
jgi:hypothetical protein